ncbi:FGGY family carbohydrate kinase [Selenomonas sputigena]|uniref:FGGY family carbohydrate kinase n=1 Tax=Selenomonas sputigena TaxID=69823 RepID=A0ABV3X7Z8_9FIRM
MDPGCQIIASGSFTWESLFENGIWTYSLDAVWLGVRECYAQLAADVEARYHMSLAKIGAIGVSAMMHGYLPFDRAGEQLVPFRTWRNNITEEAADVLTEVFRYNIPQRWSIAHLYQAILRSEEHVRGIAFFTTLSGYVHWKLCGEKVLGIGDASGMFPVDEKSGTYDQQRLDAFSRMELVKDYSWEIGSILPRVLRAGQNAGILTSEGARLLDKSGKLEEGSLMVPPEGDAGTGMVSTNAVRKRMGNISVGTSAFSMNVLDAPLREIHRDIDIVATPNGVPVAMVHTNNCSSDINAWVGVFWDFAKGLGTDLNQDQLYKMLFCMHLRRNPMQVD